MQIAVTEPHLAGLAPLVEQIADTRQFTIERGLDAADLPWVEPGRPALAQDPDIRLDEPRYGGGPTMIRALFSLGVKLGDMRGQRVEKRRRQCPAPRHTIEQILL